MDMAQNPQISHAPSCAGESENQQNERLVKTHGQRLDARAKEATRGFDSALEAIRGLSAELRQQRRSLSEFKGCESHSELGGAIISFMT